MRHAVGRHRYALLDRYPELDVHLLGPSRWQEFGRRYDADPIVPSPIRVHLEPIALPHLPGMSWYGHFYPGLRKLIRRLSPDVIHLWEEPWSVVAFQALLLRGNAALVLEVDQNILKRLPRPFEWVRRYVLKRTDLVIARSPEAKEVVEACGYRGPVHFMGYAVDPEIFYPAPLPRDAVGRPLRISYVGRLIEEKGIDDALRALAMADAPIELTIMGEGPHEGALRDAVCELGLEDRVAFRPWNGPQGVAEVFRDSDVSILLTRSTPAVREQFGRAIIESQSCATPVIGSTCGAIPSVIGAGGWVIPERDQRALATLLNRLAADRGEILERAAAARQNTATRFTAAIIASTLAEAWKQAACRRRPDLFGRFRSAKASADQ